MKLCEASCNAESGAKGAILALRAVHSVATSGAKLWRDSRATSDSRAMECSGATHSPTAPSGATSVQRSRSGASETSSKAELQVL